MSARERLNRWVEAMQILCGHDDNPGAERRAGYEATRTQFIDAYRAEVLAEADLLPKADVVAWLRKKDREFRADGDPRSADVAAALASKAARGAIRPDNLRTLPDTADRARREEFLAGLASVGGTPDGADPQPNFFQPNRTYLHKHRWKFRCDAVATHPITGKRVAVGYSIFSPSDCQTSNLGDGAWADGDWTDITGPGETP